MTPLLVFLLLFALVWLLIRWTDHRDAKAAVKEARILKALTHSRRPHMTIQRPTREPQAKRT